MSDRLPVWLEWAEIAAVLRHFVKQLNMQPADQRSRPMYYRTNQSLLGFLYNPHEHGYDELLWNAIEAAEADGVFKIEEGKRQPWEARHKNARLRFEWSAEKRVREWLSMPSPTTATPWFLALKEAGDGLNTDFLETSSLAISGRDDLEVVRALQSIRIELLQGSRPTLRQIAARHLWGASKALDTKGGEWLSHALGVSSDLVSVRRVNVLVDCASALPTRLLFVENQDTFDLLTRRSPLDSDYAVVYLSGFQGAAQRIREPEAVSLFFGRNVSSEAAREILRLWHDESAVPAEVWTDLDYAGLNIAIALRKVFPALSWYDPGYVPMQARLACGQGHGFDEAAKGNQLRPSPGELWGEGIGYLESILRYERFVDQEAIGSEDIAAKISM